VKTRLFSGAPDSFGHTTQQQRRKYEKLFALIALTGCLAVPSFASDVAGRSVKVAGKDSAKAVTVTAKAGVKVVKFLF
jgi:hypothetical protein